MIASVHFRRGDHCPHDEHRECTPCFKEGMIEWFDSVAEFEEAWHHRTMPSSNEDGVESFEVFQHDTQGPRPQTLAESAVRARAHR